MQDDKLEQNVYDKPITLNNILKFAIPTIVMSVFISFYTMVDGLLVSNLIGTNVLSAINLTAPIIQAYDGNLHYAGHRRKRSCHEKNRRKEI